MQRTFRPSCLIVLFALLVITAHPLPGAESRWIRLRTAEFEVYSNASPRAARDTLREFEQVRGFFLQRSNKQPSKASPVRLVLFGSDKEFTSWPINHAAANAPCASSGKSDSRIRVSLA